MIQHRFIFGMDYAASSDYAAVACLDTRHEHTPKPDPRYMRGGRYVLTGLDFFNEKEPATLHEYSNPSDAYDDRIIDYLCDKFFSRMPYHGNAVLGLDVTSRGRELLRWFRNSPRLKGSGVRVYAYDVRQSGTVTGQRQSGLITTTRRDLLTTMNLALKQRRIVIPEKLGRQPMHGITLVQELSRVQVKESRRGDDDEDPVSGPAVHDDRVFALAIAVRLGETMANQGIGGIVPVSYA
jgi:hypothetical protein